MNTYLKNIVSVLVFALCYLSFMPQITFAKSSTALSSRHDVVGGLEELYANMNITNFIASYSSIAGYNAYDWYGEPTSVENIYQAAVGVGESYSISYYYGHGQVRHVMGIFEDHYDMDTDNGTTVADDWIYPYSQCQNVRFVLMWSCHLGDKIGGTHFWSGVYGMPHCWLHTTDLSNDGYDDPDDQGFTFVGFKGVTVGLTDDHFTENETYLEDAGYRFLKYFYFATLNFGHYYSINEALDFAVGRVWGYWSFEESFLYEGYILHGGGDSFEGQMVVYGDGNLHISDLLVAMKTQTDGYFYLPFHRSDSFSIKSLFNDTNIVGDQVGTEVAGYPFQFPDGIVDIKDIAFICKKFGLCSFDIGWDFMVDVNSEPPSNRIVDIRDISSVCQNFGKIGNYITDLTGITVTFNTGNVTLPDSNGFVEVPEGAGNFIVKRYNETIGSMIIFY